MISFFMIFGGYFIGKLFVRLNPFLMIIGFIFMAVIASALIELNNDYYTGCFIFGAILNFSRPVTFIRDLLSNFSLRRSGANYVANIEAQKLQAEDELYSQKHQVEEELRRQKHEAEQDIERQRRDAEEAIKRQAENLRREQDRYQRSKSESENNNQQSQSSSSKGNQEHLNPLVFADACKILGLSQYKTLKEYKRAYLQLMKLYHSDKLAGLSDELRKQEEEKTKALNVAINTIKKRFK